jgi:hypothetical protein
MQHNTATWAVPDRFSRSLLWADIVAEVVVNRGN